MMEQETLYAKPLIDQPSLSRVVVFGATLFLTAVSTTLQDQTDIALIHLPDTKDAAAILEQKPAIVIWERHCPPDNLPRLLKVGIWLVETNPLKNTLTIQHRNQLTEKTISLNTSTDLIACIQTLIGKSS